MRTAFMRRLILLWLLSVAAVSPAFSQDIGPGGIDYETAHLSRVLKAVRITGEITLDGRLDEPEWNLASPATDFTQRQPFTGSPSHERTEVRVLYDDDNLYVGVLLLRLGCGPHGHQRVGARLSVHLV